MYYVSIADSLAKVTPDVDCCPPDSLQVLSFDSLAEALWTAKTSKLPLDLTDVKDEVNRECGYYHCCHVVRFNDNAFRLLDHSQSTWDSIRHLDNDRILTIGKL
jgi:hypothetical protein